MGEIHGVYWLTLAPGTLPPTLSPVPIYYCFLSLPLTIPSLPPTYCPHPQVMRFSCGFSFMVSFRVKSHRDRANVQWKLFVLQNCCSQACFSECPDAYFGALSEGHCYNDETGADIRGISSIQFTVCVVWISQTTGRDINVRGFF